MLLLTLMLLFAAPGKGITVTTRDSTTIRQGTYSSLLFVAEPARSPGNIPLQYQFTQSGTPPPGMKFEPSPCNKPGLAVCPQLASANGIFLDGVPTSAGSYSVVVNAIGPSRKRASRQFTIVVEPR